MNTIQVQLSEKHYDTLMSLLDYAQENIVMDMDANRKHGDEDTDGLEEFQDRHGEIVKELTSTKTYLWTSSMGDIELEIPADAVDEIARPGQNFPAVERWLSEPSYLKAKFDRWEQDDVQAAREYLKEAGIDEVDDKSDECVAQYVLWMACHDIKDERGQED